MNSSWTHNSFFSVRKIECFRLALEIGASTRGKRLLGVVAPLRPCANALLRHGRMFPSSLPDAVVASVFPSFVHASRDLRLLHMTTSWLQSKQRPSIHHISSIPSEKQHNARRLTD